jgi:hypothetical protein
MMDMVRTGLVRELRLKPQAEEEAAMDDGQRAVIGKEQPQQKLWGWLILWREVEWVWPDCALRAERDTKGD